MRVSIVVVLLFVSEALTQGEVERGSHVVEGQETSILTDTDTANVPDIWTELKELRDRLSATETRLAASEEEIKEMKSLNGAMAVQVEDLKTETAGK